MLQEQNDMNSLYVATQESGKLTSPLVSYSHDFWRCNHANENPNYCDCSTDCVCKLNTCRMKTYKTDKGMTYEPVWSGANPIAAPVPVKESPTTDELLKEILIELRKLNKTKKQKETPTNPYPYEPYPYNPSIRPIPIPTPWDDLRNQKNRCPKCFMDWDRVMGYCCPDHYCPVRPQVICTTADGKTTTGVDSWPRSYEKFTVH